MGVFRRKKNGEHQGNWMIQYPYEMVEMPDPSDPGNSIKKVKYKTETVGPSKREANRLFRKRMTEWEEYKRLGRRVTPLEKGEDFGCSYTFGDLMDWYLELSATKKKASYNKDVQRGKILKKHFGKLPAREIKPSMVNDFKLKMEVTKSNRGSYYRPATINRMLALMKRIYNLAIQDEKVQMNPCFKVTMLRENNVRDVVISYDEFLKLIEVMPEHVANVVTVAYYTGMRKGEILNLTWDRIFLEEGYILLRSEDTKNEHEREVPLFDNLVHLFSDLNKVRAIDHDFVFTYRNRPLRDVRESFNKACQAIGLENFKFHDLRHTFVTSMRKAGVHQTVIMEMTGHRTRAMFDRYNKIDGDDKRVALEQFEALIKSQNTTEILLNEDFKKIGT